MAAPVIVKIAPQHEPLARKSGGTPSKCRRLDTGHDLMAALEIMVVIGFGALVVWARAARYPLLRLSLVAAAGTATAYAIVAVRAVLS